MDPFPGVILNAMHIKLFSTLYSDMGVRDQRELGDRDASVLNLVSVV